jgi:hypothetical protein
LRVGSSPRRRPTSTQRSAAAEPAIRRTPDSRLRPRGDYRWSVGSQGPLRNLAHAFAASAGVAVVLGGPAAWAQSIEPRAFSPGPIGVNFVIAGLTKSTGGLSTDDLPVTDPKLTVAGPFLAYARTVELWGESGKVDIVLPMGRLQGSAIYQGAPVSREVSGLGDPLVRVSVLFRGAPAMTASEFRSYRPDLILGASVQVSLPLGQYEGSRLLNLGANRWFVRSQVGGSRAWGPWTVEGALSATAFSENDDFFGGNHRRQEPIWSAGAHAIYSFPNGVWASLDTTYYTGGRTHLNGVAGDDLQRNWRLGATLALPVSRRVSLKFNASRGVSARTGNNYDLLGVAAQYRWGAGL